MPASEKIVVPTVASFIDLAAQPALRVGGCRAVRGAGAGTRLIGATDQVPSRPSGKHESPHQIRCLAFLGRFLFEATVRLCILSNACRFPARSPVLSSWLARMESEFSRGSPVDYHYPLQALDVSVKEWGLTTAIADVDETSPVSRFLKA